MTKRVVIGGVEYDVDDDALAAYAAKGGKFDEVPTPKAEQTGPLVDVGRLTPKGSDQGLLTDIVQGAGDLGRGIAHGASAGAVEPLIPESLGVDSYDTVKERSPVLSTVGDVVGSVAGPLGKLGMAAKEAGVGARVLRSTLAGGAEGGTRAMFEGKDAGGAAESAGLSAVLAGATGVLGHGVAALAGKAKEGLSGMADSARMTAFGIGAKARAALAEHFGVDDLPQVIASEIERVQPTGWKGMSLDKRAQGLGKMRDVAGQNVGRAVDDIEASGANEHVPGFWKDAQDRFENHALGVAERGYNSDADLLGSAMLRRADKSRAAVEPKTFSELKNVLTNTEASGRNNLGAKLDNAAAQSDLKMAELIREGRNNLLDQHVPQEIADNFHGANDRFGDVAKLHDIAQAARYAKDGESRLPALASSAAAFLVSPKLAAVNMASGTRSMARQFLEGSQTTDALANAARKVSKMKAQPVRAVTDRLSPAAAMFGPDLIDDENQ